MAQNKAKFNKFLTGAVTATMVATAVVPVAAAASFTDTDNLDAKVKAEVNKAVELGFFKNAEKFNPATQINRGQAALTLARYIAGSDDLKAYVATKGLETSVTAFKDVPASWKDGAAYQAELYYASLIVKKAGAFTQENLNATGNMTRSQMAKVIVTTFGLEKAAGYTSNITDIGHLDAATKGYIETLASQGVTNVTAFNPAGNVTRSQMASFLVRSYDVVNAEPATPEVVSVTAINAKTVEVKFNKAIDKATVLETAGTLKAGVFVFATLDGNTITNDSPKGELSKDGKTLTITAQTTQVFEGRYDVTIDGAKDKDGNVVEKYVAKNLDFGKDAVAPTITGTERISSNKVKVKFSEPLVFAAGALSAKYTDTTLTPALAASDITVGGTNLPALAALAAAPVSELVLDLGAAVKDNKDIVVTFNGVADAAGNLLNPQPATVTIKKEAEDGIEPAINTVSQTGAKTFVIKFNKDLDGTLETAVQATAAANVQVTGGATAQSIEKISASEYEVTVDNNLKELQTVTVAANKAVDLAGKNNAAALTKLVTFKEDTAAPKATSKLVVGKDNKEYIELTFDKDVVLGNVTINGSYVKDYVTTTLAAVPVAAAVYADGKGDNKKVVRVPLATSVTPAQNLAVEGAVYNLTLTSAAVMSDAGVAMESVKVNFTRGKDGQATNVNTYVLASTDVAVTAHTLPVAVQDNDTVAVTFTVPLGEKLDGATATNVANYAIAGAVIESVVLEPVSGTTQVVKLKLKSDSNTFTGVRNITVKNVKIAGSSKVMEPVTINNRSLNENVTAKVEKAELTANNKVTVTFSEAVTVTADTNDFSLLIGGKTVADTVTGEAKTDKVIVFTLENPVDAAKVAEGIELKVQEDTIDIYDAAGNKVSTKGNIKIVTN